MTLTPHQFLRTYFSFQLGVALDELHELELGTLCYTRLDMSPFWNCAVIDALPTLEQLRAIEKKFAELQRPPALYFVKDQTHLPLEHLLTTSNYHVSTTDAFLFYPDTTLDHTLFRHVRKVENESDLAIFLDTFQACYQKDDPQNPYGEVGPYLETTRNAWLRHHATNRLEYFIAYKDDAPVAVATLNNYEGIGYVSNVGSLRSVRGQGFGKAVTLACIAQSQLHGNHLHCLATEAGSYPYQFYQGIGFHTEFEAVLMVKEQHAKTTIQ